jgi:hypothetical protein
MATSAVGSPRGQLSPMAQSQAVIIIVDEARRVWACQEALD